MNPPNEIIVDEKTMQLLDIASATDAKNLQDIIDIVGVDYRLFKTFITEIGYEEHPDALHILDLLKDQTSQIFQTYSGSPIPKIQSNFDISLNDEFRSSKKTFALVIGVNSYVSDSFANLEPVKRDAIEISSYLMRNFQNVNVDFVTDSQATSSNIKKRLELLSRNVTEEDSVFIYFACHAWTGKINNERLNFFCTQNTVLDSVRETSIMLEEFKLLTSNFRADKMLLVLDTCLPKDLLTSNMRNAWQELGSAYRSLLSRSGEAVIAINRSSTVRTFTEETPEYRKIYTSYLLDALEGSRKDIVRIRTLYYFMRKSLEEDQIEYEEGEDDLILLQYESDQENFPIFEY